MRLALFLAIGCVAVAQPKPSQSRCFTGEEFRRFDFWVGEWDVEVNARKVARSRIEKSPDGCRIVENWMPFGGSEGKSWNFYDPGKAQWEQVWITPAGGVLKVAGGWKDGAIREQGTSVSEQGEVRLHRHSFTPLPDGKVRQFCEESADGGKTWQVTFEGIYIRR
jgi:hypothetical protein